MLGCFFALSHCASQRSVTPCARSKGTVTHMLRRTRDRRTRQTRQVESDWADCSVYELCGELEC